MNHLKISLFQYKSLCSNDSVDYAQFECSLILYETEEINIGDGRTRKKGGLEVDTFWYSIFA